MAAPELRVVRRPRGYVRPSLTAASAPIDNPGKTFKNQVSMSGRLGWQTEAWELMDCVGELRYYVSWRSNACSRVRLIASELDHQGMPTGECANERVRQIVNSIASNALGQSQLIKRAVECLSVVGEVWIAIIYRPNSPVAGEWMAFSRDEIKKKGQKVSVELPDGTDYELNNGTDSIFRAWVPHPRRAKEADSPVRASMDPLREIVRTTRKIRNADNSRLIGNGVVFVPQEMSLPMAASPVSADKPEGSIAPVALQGIPAVQELQELLFNVAKVSFEDEDSFAAMIPIFASVPGDFVGKIEHLTFDNQVTDLAIKTRNDAIARLAMGLEISPERLLGLGSSTNHWSAWTIGDNDVQLHVAPAMETLCQAISDQVLRKTLSDEGIDPDKYLLWYDAFKLTADPDKTDTSTDAFDRGVINAAAYRDFLGLGETGYDFTSLEGWRVWAQDKVSQDPKLLPELLPLLDTKLQNLEFPALNPPPGPGSGREEEPKRSDTTNEGKKPKTEDKDPGYDQGKRDRKNGTGKAAVTKETAFVKVFVDRALELAGKRRRTRADYERLRDIPMHQTHRAMGPVGDEEIPELIKGWDSALEDEVLAVLGIDRDEFSTAVRQEVRRQLTAEMVTA